MTRFADSAGTATRASHLLRTSSSWLVVGIVVLLVNGLIAAWSFREIDEADYWVAHTHEVIEGSEQLQFDVKSAEGLSRAYLLQPVAAARTAFDRAAHDVQAHFADLKTTTIDNAAQQERLAALDPLLRERVTDLGAVMDLRDKAGLDAAEKRREFDQLKHLSARIQTACTTIESEEKRLLADREQIRRQRKIEALVGLAVSSVLILIALLIGPVHVSTTTKRLIEADRALEASAAELRRLTGRLITSQEEERRRIARNLHDDLSQNLAYLSIDLGQLAEKVADSTSHERLLRLKKKAGETADLVRSISHELHPSTLDDLGLETALEEHCAEFEERTGIATSLEFRSAIEETASEITRCTFFVVAESLRNIGKHSGASMATVTVKADPGGLHATIADDGKGIDEKVRHEQSGIGLTTMRERLFHVGGTMSIRKAGERGTIVEFTIPGNGKSRS